MARSTRTGDRTVLGGPLPVTGGPVSYDSVVGPRVRGDTGACINLDDALLGPSRPSTGEFDPWAEERGFTLAAMMVIMAVMAIFLTVAVETTTFQARREKEEELIFRGGQAVEAIRLFRARNGRYPMRLGELVTAKPRVLRKVWADPMTGKPDWIPVFLGEEGVPIGKLGGGPEPTPTPGFGQSPTPTPVPGTPGQPGTGTMGPIVGVLSRACDNSIKIWNGHTRYCEWKFIFDPTHPFGPVVAPIPVPNPTAPK